MARATVERTVSSRSVGSTNGERSVTCAGTPRAALGSRSGASSTRLVRPPARGRRARSRSGRLRVCRWQRVRLLGAPGRPDQGRVLPRRRRRLLRRRRPARSPAGGRGRLRLEHPGEDPAPGGRDLRLRRADNPFADYSFIYVPSCTGDVHLGDVTREYSPELTVEHNGFVNGTAALDYLAEHYPDADQVVVVGKTAGRSPPRSTAASSPTCSPTPRSPCSAPSPAAYPRRPRPQRRDPR